PGTLTQLITKNSMLLQYAYYLEVTAIIGLQ
ncbi:MAG: hypothetical protein K0Q78_681, partial [Cellvibrio sp.]|nr:hypothetical protein [Cellvibrio sp.]